MTSFNLNDIQGGPISKHGHTGGEGFNRWTQTFGSHHLGRPTSAPELLHTPGRAGALGWEACFRAAGTGVRRGPPWVPKAPTGPRHHLLDAIWDVVTVSAEGASALRTSSPALTSPRSKGSSQSTLAAAIPTCQLPAWPRPEEGRKDAQERSDTKSAGGRHEHASPGTLFKRNRLSKSQMQVGIILEFFEKYKCQDIALPPQSSRYVSNEQPCLKTTGLCEDLLLLSSSFHFFYFMISAPISFSLCFPISPSLFFKFLSQALSSVVEKFCVYIYIIVCIHTYYMYTYTYTLDIHIHIIGCIIYIF